MIDRRDVREPLIVRANEESIGRLDIEIRPLDADASHDDELRRLRYECELWKAVVADLQGRLAEHL